MEAFEEEEDIAPVPMPPQEVVTPQIKTPSIPEPLSEKEQFLNSISAHLVFFNAILQENASEQCRYAKEKRLMAEAIVDEINESAVDILGDIVIEEADDGFRIIEDYQGIFENND